jgi:hypothetical protein
MPTKNENTASALREDFSLLVGGELIQSADRLDVIDPSTGRVFARCPAGGAVEL